MSIRVEGPGAYTTVQDLGRSGFGASGVPPSGAMDEISFRAANLLAGNGENAAGLEITMAGPELVFTAEHLVAVTGASFEPRVDGIPVPTAHRSFVVPAGATLSIGKTRVGLRCYLAVHGGIDAPLVLGSRSTFVPARFGGVDGRPLGHGAMLGVGTTSDPMRVRVLRRGALVEPEREPTLRAVPGPQEAAFTGRGLAVFFSSQYRVSPRSDRAGVRLDGERVELAGDADLDPEGVMTGSVQVPADGMPIVLGPDRPATGGYVKIATVISADLPLLAQARPGDALRFAAITVEDARAARRERLDTLRDGIEELG